MSGTESQFGVPQQWQPLAFLLGEWEGVGGGGPGDGSGWFTFTLAAQGAVMVRTNHAEYPATESTPAYAHDDLMVVYHDPDTREMRADYYDNEGHVIRYRVTADSGDGQDNVVFMSDPVPGQARFQLTYTASTLDTLALTFAIAPPGQEHFQPYIEATARRK